ncbi:MAG: DUF1302 family protein [Thermodesulfobacteriota bacterium]|nr:DUF1302 family protein [Thermodesulfobacteriota bacterium]
MKYICFYLFGLFFVLLQPAVLCAQDLDDILSGFDTAVEEPENKNITDDVDDLLSGFDDTPAEAEEKDASNSSVIPEWLQLTGSVGLAGSVNFAHDAPEENEADFRDLSMLRTTVTLSSEMRWGDWQAKLSGHGFYDAAYSIQGREQYSNTLLDDYEQEFEIDDLYLQGSLTSNLDIKTGRQIVVWGKSDNVRVTDILNPLDNRLPGMVDIKYRRLPVTMTRLDYYTGAWNLSGIMIHEVRFDKNPVYNSDFYPGKTPLPPEEKPDVSLDNQQYGLALNGIFSGWDLSLYGAWVYDGRAHVTEDVSGSLYREHSRVFMTGMTVNMAFGNWLLKGEGAWFDGLEFATVADDEFSRLDLMAGIEYMGFSETVLSLEIVNRHLLDFDEQLALSPDIAQEDLMQTVATLVRDFANDSIQFKILLSVFGAHGEDGAFERFQLDYDLTDSVTMTGGVIFYQSADQGALSTIEDNDRVFFELIYEF